MASLSACHLAAPTVATARPSTVCRTRRAIASLRCAASSVPAAEGDDASTPPSRPSRELAPAVVVGRRAFAVGAALVASAVDASSNPAAAFERPPPGFKPFNDTIDGYKLYRPDGWIDVKGSGNDIFFRNADNAEENMFVAISSPSSIKFASVADLGTPDDAARKVLEQYLTEFMSTRIGVRRQSSVVSATERMGTGLDGKPSKFYDVRLRISSYATKNQYGLTEADRPQTLEWDRVLTSALGTANGRLYELRMQTSADTVANSEKTFAVVRDSFTPFEVDESNLSFPLLSGPKQ
eukprot:CAMPEP_0181361310 /NCGR_PEP_ID=MMETSP1106-20121128/7203_1 /TAXON_ID=81844 /ORGANISM="Mantoniella antarctica, Strain SL-175" /LENGTH=294 /DNA_ID=CAMNT_0023474785 /DNA_START=11 /DNA_END=895 /DNA_ORIENTATION=+